MSENYRALVALLVLSVPTLWYLRKTFAGNVIARSDFNVRAGLWIFLTIVLFTAQSFWLFVLATVLVLLTVGRRDSNPLGLYVFLIFLAPSFQSAIQGFSGINYFIAVDYQRVLSVFILLPLAGRLLTTRGTPALFGMPTDKYLFAYIALLLIIQAPLTSATDLLRAVVTQLIDVLLPYYCFSRGIRDLRRLKETVASFVAVCVVIAVIAVFEFFKGWLLYSSLPSVLNVHWSYGNYASRNGALRATVSLGHSIVLGYVLAVALGLHMMLRPIFPSARLWVVLSLVLAAGVLASMSRGPWVGAAGMLLVLIGLGPKLGERIGKLGAVALLALPVLVVTGLGPVLASYIPFVGDVDAANVTYRQQLFDVSWSVLMLNPLFGSPYFMSNAAMEQMRQGEGIIDMVNTYLSVAMVSGLVGLSLFSGSFVSIGIRLSKHLIPHPAKDGDDYVIGRALLAALVAVLIIIATVSNIMAIPIVYCSLIGMCAAYLRLVTSTHRVPANGPRKSAAYPGRRGSAGPSSPPAIRKDLSTDRPAV